MRFVRNARSQTDVLLSPPIPYPSSVVEGEGRARGSRKSRLEKRLSPGRWSAAYKRFDIIRVGTYRTTIRGGCKLIKCHGLACGVALAAEGCAAASWRTLRRKRDVSVMRNQNNFELVVTSSRQIHKLYVCIYILYYYIMYRECRCIRIYTISEAVVVATDVDGLLLYTLAGRVRRRAATHLTDAVVVVV